MSNTPYGLSALMETINHIAVEEKNLDTINDIAAGTMENVTYLDAIEAGLIKSDDVEVDDEMEDVEDEVDPNDPEINRMLDNIEPTEDDDVSLESLDYALESYIDKHY